MTAECRCTACRVCGNALNLRGYYDCQWLSDSPNHGEGCGALVVVTCCEHATTEHGADSDGSWCMKCIDHYPKPAPFHDLAEACEVGHPVEAA